MSLGMELRRYDVVQDGTQLVLRIDNVNWVAVASLVDAARRVVADVGTQFGPIRSIRTMSNPLTPGRWVFRDPEESS